MAPPEGRTNEMIVLPSGRMLSPMLMTYWFTDGQRIVDSYFARTLWDALCILNIGPKICRSRRQEPADDEE